MMVNLQKSVKGKNVQDIILAKVYTVDRSEVESLTGKINKAI